MKLQTVKITDLKFHPKNPNTHPEFQVKELQNSLDQFDQVKNIVVWQGLVIAGNGLLEAAKLQNRETIEIQDVSDWPEDKALKFMIADNRIQQLAVMDDDILSGLLIDFDEPLDIPGIDEDFLDGLDLGGGDDENKTDPDNIPEVVEPLVKSGELWLLGNHRLLCGDCTVRENVEKLINGNKIELLFIDPPYGINVIKNNQIGGRGPVGGKKNYKKSIRGDNIVKAGKYKPIIGDDKDFNPNPFLEYADNAIIFGGNYFATKLPNSRGWFIWDKIDGMEGTTKNFSDFEMAWTSFDKPARLFRHRWQGLMKGSERNEKRCHPTQKPVQLLIDIIKYYSENNEVIMDLFLGSGSTLLACERTNHTSYGMELEPAYCDIILQRWTDYTGKDPIREDGVKFSELKAIANGLHEK